jgi:Zn-dependent protease with chaperone function
LIGWLTVSLEAAAIAAAVGALVSGLTPLALRGSAGIRPAARRADAAFVIGLTPMLVTVSLWGALLLPSVLHIMGIRVDHCASHSHHAHLCAIHSVGPGLALVALGALALALAIWRGARLGRAQLRSMRLVQDLENLGLVRDGGPFPIVEIPGSPRICLAAGGWRRRVLMSGAIVRQLDFMEVQAALAHEQAHLIRHDPLLKIVLAWAGLCSTPSAATAAQQSFADAAEEASDAQAAEAVGALQVAGSLVSMARLTRASAPATCMAFGDCSLERRVTALVEGTPRTQPSRSMALAVAMGSTAAMATTISADGIHHAVETMLQLFG